jgi:hypothetical protein
MEALRDVLVHHEWLVALWAIVSISAIWVGEFLLFDILDPGWWRWPE